MNDSIQVFPLMPDRWQDLETLFGPNGAHGGCWCRWFKLTGPDFNQRRGEGNKQDMKRQVENGPVPGLLAYQGDTVVGWCAVEPREHYPRLNRSPIVKPVDQAQVWSLTCFSVARKYRGRKITRDLISAAIDYVKKQDGQILEAYPVHPDAERIPAPEAYHGIYSSFKDLGFKEVARRSPTRPIMRYYL